MQLAITSEGRRLLGSHSGDFDLVSLTRTGTPFANWTATWENSRFRKKAPAKWWSGGSAPVAKELGRQHLLSAR